MFRYIELNVTEKSVAAQAHQLQVQRLAAKGLGIVYVSQLYPLKKEVQRLRKKDELDRETLLTLPFRLKMLQKQKDQLEAAYKSASDTLQPLQEKLEDRTKACSEAEAKLANMEIELMEQRERATLVEAQVVHLVGQVAKAEVGMRRLDRELGIARKREGSAVKEIFTHAHRAEASAYAVESMATRVLTLEQSFGQLLPDQKKTAATAAGLLSGSSLASISLAQSTSSGSISPPPAPVLGVAGAAAGAQQRAQNSFMPRKPGTPVRPSQTGTLSRVRQSSSLSSLTGALTQGTRALSRPSSQGVQLASDHQPYPASPLRHVSKGFPPGPGRRPTTSNSDAREQLQQRAVQHMQAKQGLGSAGSAPLVLTSREFEKIVEHADDSFVTIKQRAANINWRESADYRSPSSLATPKSVPPEDGSLPQIYEEARKVAFVEFRDSMPYYREDSRSSGLKPHDLAPSS